MLILDIIADVDLSSMWIWQLLFTGHKQEAITGILFYFMLLLEKYLHM